MSTLLSRLEHVSSKATGRYKEVVDSFLSFYARNGRLTPSQESYFENIESNFSSDEIERRKKWKQGYSSSHRDVAIKCAHYYNTTMYFRSLVNLILADPEGHFLTEKQFNKMCNNKYSLKILKEYNTPPAFEAGQFVKTRAKNSLSLPRDTPAVILQVNAAPITKARKGARVYSILPVGGTSTYLALESELKRGATRR